MLFLVETINTKDNESILNMVNLPNSYDINGGMAVAMAGAEFPDDEADCVNYVVRVFQITDKEFVGLVHYEKYILDKSSDMFIGEFLMTDVLEALNKAVGEE